MNVQRTTRTSSEKSKQVMAVGIYHLASLQSCFPPSRAVVCAEHSVRFRGRYADACPEVQVWEKGVISGVLLMALMVWPLQPASYGLAGIMLATGLVLVYPGQAYWMYRIGIILSLLSLCSLTGISHIRGLRANGTKTHVKSIIH